jgi:hypothetical protein
MSDQQCQRPLCTSDDKRLTHAIRVDDKAHTYVNVCSKCATDARAAGFTVHVRYVRAHPCPECKHDTAHEDEVCYCEEPGCDCDRTSVDDFWIPAA